MFNTLLHLPTSIRPSSFTSSRVCRKIISKKMSTNSIEPKVRKFESVEGADINSRTKPDGIRFRLVSYNILAQVFLKSSYFPHSPPGCLKWKTRSQAILSVLKNLDADFFCLQEVDQYDSFYRQKMESLGYSAIYIHRTGQKRDGCAIFYKPNCAELVTRERIEYNDLVDSVKADSVSCGEQKIETSNEAKGDAKAKVANTHIYWDPELADVKFAQVNYLLSRLAKFKTKISDEFECTPSVLLAGDFNSVPGSKVYSYLVSGNVEPAEAIEDEEAPVPLRSVYEVTIGEPKFTNCTPGFTDTLDYIFFSPSDLIKPVSILQLPDPDSPDVAGFLPNYHHPSDHLPIGAEFEIRRD